LGIPYLHYIQFRLLGGTVLAAEITNELTSVVLYPITVVVFLRFFIKDWTRVAAWAAIVMAGSIALRMTSVLGAGNRLLGIRSTMPVLLSVVLCLSVNRVARTLLTGVCLGLVLVLGTEQGLAIILALGLATGVVALRSRARVTYLAETAAAIAIGAAML